MNDFEPSQGVKQGSRYIYLAIVFISLWFFRLGIHGWDNGIFMDDWEIFGTHHTFDEIPHLKSIFSFSHFFRPLGSLILLNLSRLWEHFQIVHLIGSLLHGVNAILVFFISQSLHLGFLGSYISCLFFLLFPIPSEAVYWASCIHNLLGVTVGSAGIFLALRYGANGLVFKLVLAAMACIAAMLYEQTALLFGVSTLICILREIEKNRWNFRRIFLCSLPVVCLGFYFILFRMTTVGFPGDRFSPNPLNLLPSKYWWALTMYGRVSIFGTVVWKFFWNGFWCGMNSILLKKWTAILFIGNVCLATIATLSWVRMRSQTESTKYGMALGVGVMTILITLAIFSLSREYGFPFRVTYTPSPGLSLLVGFIVVEIFRLVEKRWWCRWFSPAIVFLIVFIFLAVDYSELTQYRRQRDLDIHQAQQLQSLIPQVNEGSFFWLLNVPWATQELNVFHAEHVLNIWVHDWGIRAILSNFYKKKVDGLPLHSGHLPLPRDFPPQRSNTYVFWFNGGSCRFMKSRL